jgi:hypothetical protein
VLNGIYIRRKAAILRANRLVHSLREPNHLSAPLRFNEAAGCGVPTEM